MQCSPRMLNLSTMPVPTNRDGWAGANAHIYAPFFGFYFFNGQTMTFPNSTIPQSQARTFRGTTLHNTFVKEGCFAAGVA